MPGGLRAEGITVAFGGVDVVSGVDLDLRPGEIHAVVGENGAGKSCLAKAIAGVYRRRSGDVFLAERQVEFRSPLEALRAGVALIHQEPRTFPDLSVAENIFVGNLPTRFGAIDWRAAEVRARSLLARVGSSLDSRRPAQGLSVASQQQIELASALAHDAKVWFFDETSAPLSRGEAVRLFALMRSLANDGSAVMMVSHHLDEVFSHADRITVLRDGKKVGETTPDASTPSDVARMMVGRDIQAEPLRGAGGGESTLQVRELSGDGFQDVSLSIAAGEIVGMFGLVGSGRTELCETLFGLRRPKHGAVLLAGETHSVLSPRDARSLGISLVPEDRRRDGLLTQMSVEFNVTLPTLEDHAARGILSSKRMRAATERYAASLKVKCRDFAQPVDELSGGNQQKIAVAKWLLTEPRVLILDEPTRGVDIGAKRDVHLSIRDQAARGLAVLMVSSDLPEIMALSDRILVMKAGRIVAEFDSPNVTESEIMIAATGAGERG